MKELLKNLGLILIILGVLAMVVAFLTGHVCNALLATAMGVILAGLVSYIFINKKVR